MCLPTIEKLRTLCVALLHFFTFIRCCFDVTNCGGEYGCPRLHQHLTEVDAVTRSGAVQRSPERNDIKMTNVSAGCIHLQQ